MKIGKALKKNIDWKKIATNLEKMRKKCKKIAKNKEKQMQIKNGQKWVPNSLSIWKMWAPNNLVVDRRCSKKAVTETWNELIRTILN